MLVSELIAFLKTFPMDAVVMSVGPDMGGYDCEEGELNFAENREGVPFVYHSGIDEGYEGNTSK